MNAELGKAGIVVLVLVICGTMFGLWINSANHEVVEDEGFISAVARGEYNLVERDLNAGADPNVMDTTGRIVLDVALRRGRYDVALLLLRHGAVPTPFCAMLSIGALLFMSFLLPFPWWRIRATRFRYRSEQETSGMYYYSIPIARTHPREAVFVDSNGDHHIMQEQELGDVVPLDTANPISANEYRRAIRKASGFAGRAWGLQKRFTALTILSILFLLFGVQYINDNNFGTGLIVAFLCAVVQLCAFLAVQILRPGRRLRFTSLALGLAVNLGTVLVGGLIFFALAAFSA